MRYPGFLTGAALLGGAAAGALALGSVSIAQAQDLPVIQMMSSNDRSCAMYPQFMMQSFGFLEKEGYKLDLLSSDTSIPYVAFLSNGDADIAVMDPGQVLQAVNAGQPIKVVYESHQHVTDGIVVLADSPIKELADLKGKTVGLASDKDILTTIIALDFAGMDVKEISTVVVGDSGPVLAKALQDGTIAAFAGAFTDRAGIEAAGVVTRDITPPEVGTGIGNSMVVWGPTMEEKRPLIHGFLRAWAQSAHSGVLETPAVFMACKTFVPEQWEKPGVGQRVVSNSVYNTQLRRSVKFGELQPDVWKAMQTPYIKMGELKGEIDPATFLDSSFIDEVNTFSTEDVKAGIAKFKADNPDLKAPHVGPCRTHSRLGCTETEFRIRKPGAARRLPSRTAWPSRGRERRQPSRTI